jgi:hypothetical protein
MSEVEVTKVADRIWASLIGRVASNRSLSVLTHEHLVVGARCTMNVVLCHLACLPVDEEALGVSPGPSPDAGGNWQQRPTEAMIDTIVPRLPLIYNDVEAFERRIHVCDVRQVCLRRIQPPGITKPTNFRAE